MELKRRKQIFNQLGNPDGQKTLDEIKDEEECSLLGNNKACLLDNDPCQKNCSISKGIKNMQKTDDLGDKIGGKNQ